MAECLCQCLPCWHCAPAHTCRKCLWERLGSTSGPVGEARVDFRSRGRGSGRLPVLRERLGSTSGPVGEARVDVRSWETQQSYLMRALGRVKRHSMLWVGKIRASDRNRGVNSWVLWLRIWWQWRDSGCKLWDSDPKEREPKQMALESSPGLDSCSCCLLAVVWASYLALLSLPFLFSLTWGQ